MREIIINFKPVLKVRREGTALAAFCLFVLIFSISDLKAQMILEGLANKPELKTYLQEKVLEKYTEEAKEAPRFSQVKTDLEKALHAKGYYDPQIIYKSEQPEVYTIHSGDVYHIGSVKVTGIGEEPEPQLPGKGDILAAQTVLMAQQALYERLAKERCIYNLSVKHQVVLDHDARTGAVEFIVSGQEGATFSDTNMTGAKTIKRSYLNRFIKYEEGACWNPEQLEKTKTALLETGLLSRADADLPETLPNDGGVPISFTLKERAPRKVRLGAKYSTSEGPGVIGEWRHLNFFGAGEELSVIGQASTLLQSLGADFTKPFFYSDKQTLNAAAKIERQDTEAFEELSLNIQTSIKRKLSDHWSGSAGVALEATTITDEDGDEDTFGLVSFPTRLNFDNRDNPLDPHRGYSFSFGLEPFADTLGQSDPFIKTRATGTTYFDLSDHQIDPVLALRASLGSITGSDTDSIPATKRFYAGGGGSIRGYGFQEAGPVDGDDDPLGGRSIVEGSAELRFKMTDTIGAVAFVDGGGAYDSAYPDFDSGVFVGAGLGARYYTEFGPIRFDVAVPLTEKDQTDQDFQIYISIGQAF